MSITRVPLRLAILRALTEALKGVNPDNGYEFDLRDDVSWEYVRPRVVRGRLHTGDDEPLPMLSIVEPPLSIEAIPTRRQPDNAAHVGEWDLIIQGWAADDPMNPTDIGYQFVSEVRHRLAQEKNRGRNGEVSILGFDETQIQNMTIGTPVVRPNEHISEQAVFYFVLTLHIAEDMAAPLG
ncbi:hypothetical protein [Paracoccus sp. (in: a-proteobacteria)]|uniref:hypothetical protein n=1 Tax=Paracoccus sp. TaxID=267 RepID=UPI0026DF0CCB|nr:hypothetical protein [Paracoccus sp. (in: a-proteobacteria)]MDO5646303.1 hypothetical protein [Paracoccus sp. (in: a-proteobacteria)]